MEWEEQSEDGQTAGPRELHLTHTHYVDEQVCVVSGHPQPLSRTCGGRRLWVGLVVLWMRMTPWALTGFSILVVTPWLVELLGRIRRFGLIGRGISVGVGFEVSKPHDTPVSFLYPFLPLPCSCLPCLWIRWKLLATACLPVAMLLAMVFIDSKPLDHEPLLYVVLDMEFVTAIEK